MEHFIKFNKFDFLVDNSYKMPDSNTSNKISQHYYKAET